MQDETPGEPPLQPSLLNTAPGQGGSAEVHDRWAHSLKRETTTSTEFRPSEVLAPDPLKGSVKPPVYRRGVAEDKTVWPIFQ